MNKPVDSNTYQSKHLHWLSKELFLKLHLEFTLLAIVQVQRRDIAEDIASQCLVDLWMAIPPNDSNCPIKAVQLNRLTELIAYTQESAKKQVAVEREHLFFQYEDFSNESSAPEDLSWLNRLIPLLEPLQQQLIRLIIEEGLDLEQIAQRLKVPFSKIKRLYKHSVFRLRKEMGQWKPYQ